MRKPRYAAELVGFIFLMIGSFFAVYAIGVGVGWAVSSDGQAALVCRILTIVFASIAAAFLLTGGALRAGVRAKLRRQEELLAQGASVMGKVEQVQYVRSVRYFRESPYRVCYSYCENGTELHGCSELLWQKPALAPGDSIRVYTDHEGHAAVKLQSASAR